MGAEGEQSGERGRRGEPDDPADEFLHERASREQGDMDAVVRRIKRVPSVRDQVDVERRAVVRRRRGDPECERWLNARLGTKRPSQAVRQLLGRRG